MNHIAILTVATLSLASIAAADFVGIAVNEQEINGNCVVDVYATFTKPVDTVITVFNVNVNIEGGFESLIHNDLLGGSWAPQLTTNPELDSFCLIGGEPGFLNTTSADQLWGLPGFHQIPIPALAGWVNASLGPQGQAQPVSLSNLQGMNTWDGYATRIMRLAFVTPPPSGKLFTFSGEILGNAGSGASTFDDRFSFSSHLCAIPAPSAVALLDIGALVSRRRRS